MSTRPQDEPAGVGAVSVMAQNYRAIQEFHNGCDGLLIGIPGNKIRVVFNKVKEDAEEEFSGIFAYAKKTKNCIANPDCAIDDDEAFDMLAARKMSIGAVVADKTDYRGMLRELNAKEGHEKEKAHYSDMHYLRGCCIAVDRNLQNAFDALFK